MWVENVALPELFHRGGQVFSRTSYCRLFWLIIISSMSPNVLGSTLTTSLHFILSLSLSRVWSSLNNWLFFIQLSLFIYITYPNEHSFLSCRLHLNPHMTEFSKVRKIQGAFSGCLHQFWNTILKVNVTGQ